MVFLGVSLVGMSSIVQAGGTEQYPIKGSWFGVCLVILAQVFTASQVAYWFNENSLLLKRKS